MSKPLIKKTRYRSNGSYPLRIKTINGSFEFLVTRYETEQGSSNWLKLTHEGLGQNQESELLEEFAVRWATRLSYQKVSQLVAERSGTARVSDQRIYQMVREKAAELVAEQEEKLLVHQESQQVVRATAVDLYDAQAAEVIWLADGICVPEQKAVRDRQAKSGKERVTTEMAMLARKDGSYRAIVAGEGVNRVALYRAVVVEEYQSEATELAVVAITDGARALKKEVKAVFGEEVSHILDWYHLESKVLQLMTQIAPTKEIKEEMQAKIINELWRGESELAVAHRVSIKARHPDKQAELQGYIEKNRDYIINYEKRKKCGKVIGSGRMEKQNDVIVATRQKRKGMSWSKSGSRNLALVTAHFNQPTDYLQ